MLESSFSSVERLLEERLPVAHFSSSAKNPRAFFSGQALLFLLSSLGLVVLLSLAPSSRRQNGQYLAVRQPTIMVALQQWQALRPLQATQAAKMHHIVHPVKAFDPAPRQNLQHVAVAAAVSHAQMTTADRLKFELAKKFRGEDVSRVVESFMRIERGEDDFKKHHEGEGLQVSGSYVGGLTSKAFFDVHDKALDLEWWVELEKNYEVVLDELRENLKNPARMERKGERIWAPAAREEAVSYGPEWRTLVLMDRGRWHPDNTKLFPKTTHLLRHTVKAPASEVFFARQTAGTGIASHTDNTNFLLTGHLALEIPKGDCFIQVGEHRRGWEQGKAMVMDTSIMHHTANNADTDRYVLIVRFWHPELSTTERKALQFVFDVLDGGFESQDELEATQAREANRKQRRQKPTGQKPTSQKSSGKGFR